MNLPPPPPPQWHGVRRIRKIPTVYSGCSTGSLCDDSLYVVIPEKHTKEIAKQKFGFTMLSVWTDSDMYGYMANRWRTTVFAYIYLKNVLKIASISVGGGGGMVTSHTVEKGGNGYITYCGKGGGGGEWLHHTLWKRGREIVTPHTVERKKSKKIKKSSHHTLWKKTEQLHHVDKFNGHTSLYGEGGQL